jgi:hypothetical protein
VRPRWWEKFIVFLHRHLFSPFAGVTAGDWLRLLRANHFAVDLPYWPRTALLTLGSLANSLERRREDREFGPAVAGIAVKPPLFVLGHWRTGTTHLHNLLAVDPRFAYPNSYQVVFPHTFLRTEVRAYQTYAAWIPQRRPQDNVRIALETPQEDEFALAILTACSPYVGWMFPDRARYYERYLTFRGVADAEVRRWKEALVHFLKKLTWRYDSPLLLKSPPHTARVRLLLELFPEARFVHIHRDPYRVFQSTVHTHETVRPGFAVQSRRRVPLEEGVLRRFGMMYDAFFEERGLIPAGRFHEMGFEDLEKDPIGQLRQAYEGLGLADFGEVEGALRCYLGSLTGYRKNELPEPPTPLRRRIDQAWRRYFEEFGYRTGG